MLTTIQTVTSGQIQGCIDQLQAEIQARSDANSLLTQVGNSPVLLDLNNEIISQSVAAIGRLEAVKNLLNQCVFNIPK